MLTTGWHTESPPISLDWDDCCLNVNDDVYLRGWGWDLSPSPYSEAVAFVYSVTWYGVCRASDARIYQTRPPYDYMGRMAYIHTYPSSYQGATYSMWFQNNY